MSITVTTGLSALLSVLDDAAEDLRDYHDSQDTVSAIAVDNAADLLRDTDRVVRDLLMRIRDLEGDASPPRLLSDREPTERAEGFLARLAAPCARTAAQQGRAEA